MADGGASSHATGIRVSTLTRRFGKVVALDAVSLEVRKGELFGIVGGDGAGKTTLLQSLCAILDPTSGEVTVEGHDSVRDAAAITSRIGYVAQSYSLYEDLTVEENLEFFGAIRGVEPAALARRRTELLQFSGLSPFLSRRARDLSGGMQKKLAVCCSLLHEPRIDFNAHPTRADFLGRTNDDGPIARPEIVDDVLGLDPVSRKELWRMLSRYHEAGNTIVLATSYMDEAARCDRVAIMNAGRVAACAPPRDLGPDLEEAVIEMLAPERTRRSGVMSPHSREQGVGAATEALLVDGLTKRFGTFVAVDHASFSLHRGEIFGLLGPNGSGKSTTIKMLCGIYPPTSGAIHVAGVDVVARPGAAKGRIGYMSQRFSLYPDLTVDENIEFFGAVYGLEGARLRQRRSAVLAQADLEAVAGHLVHSLSGATRQHVALGCALLHEPDILFLDEPTSGVDPAARRDFWDLIRELAAAGTAVLVTTHYLKEAEACGRVAFIDKGRIVTIDAPAAIRARYATSTLEEAFLKAIEGAR